MDGKDEALLCEGECGLWFHRGCASIPPSRYKILAESEEPFLCLSCVNVRLMEEIALLKIELNGIAEVRERCAALSDEVSSLRGALDALRKEPTTSASLHSSSSSSAATIANQRPAGKKVNRSYAKVASTRQPTTHATNNASSGKAKQQVRSTVRRENTSSAGLKIKVEGASWFAQVSADTTISLDSWRTM